jgi:GDSL-like Lipase/Acylhydrolase family
MADAPMRRIKNLAINAGLIAGSILICLVFFELVVFRFVLVASDVPANDFVNGLVRYAPNQTGVWRVRNEIAAPYAINAQGWNSGIGDYAVARKPGVKRVAVVGDSYVEALQVPHDRSVGERLAAELSRGAEPVEVYRFGISAAPLSQYLLMVEREVARYKPDWIVVVLIHNDFPESLNPLAGRYTSSFLKVRVAEGRVVEIAPRPWRPGLTDWIRRTATMRYLYYRLHFPIEAWRDWLIPRARAGTDRFSANVDIDAVLRQMPDIAAATDHLFGRLLAVARGSGAGLLLAMDGDRQSIYAGAREARALALNTMAADLARKHGIAFVDLHSAFSADWRANGTRFEHPSDNHWNEHAHAVAAHAVARAMREQN